MESKELASGQPIAPVVAAYRGFTPPAGLHYRSPRFLSYFAIAGVALFSAGFVIMIVNNIADIRRLSSGAGPLLNQEDVSVTMAIVLLFMAFTLIAGFVASTICFSLWFYRAYRNLPTLVSGKLLTTPGWAVGSFFIPFLNLFRPYQAAREIEVYSDPEFAGGRFASDVGGSGLLKTWWTLWIMGNILSRMSNRISDQVKDVDALIALNWFDAFSSLLIVLAGISLIVLVRRTTNNQDAAAELVGNAVQGETVSPAM